MSLPEVIQHQDFLLTLNTNEESIIKDALPGVDVYPLFLDPENGTWVVRAKFKPGITLPKHYHTGVVHFYTLSGAGTTSSIQTKSKPLVATYMSRAVRLIPSIVQKSRVVQMALW